MNRFVHPRFGGPNNRPPMGIGGPRFHRGIPEFKSAPNLDRRDPEKAQNLSFKKVQGNTGNRLVHLGYAGMEIVRVRVLDRRIEVVSSEGHPEGPRKFVPRNDPFEHKPNSSRGHGTSSRPGGKPPKVTPSKKLSSR